jgi:hypothetical protein
MKSKLYSKALFLSLFILGLFSSNSVQAQCSGGVPYLSLSPTQSWQTFSGGFAGEYQDFTAIAGATYEFSYCAADGGSSSYDTEITLQNANGTPLAYNDDFCGAQSRLTWTAPSAGTYRLLTTEYNCMSNFTSSTLAYRILSQPNPNNDVYLSSATFGSEYLRIPLAQVQAQVFSGEVTNGSTSTATGFGLKVDVINAGNNSIIQTFTSALTNAPGGTVQAYNNFGSWTPSTIGTYRIRYTALATSQNGNASNDTTSYLLAVTDTVYGRDDNVPLGTLAIGSVTSPSPGELGVNYQLFAPANLKSIGLRVNNSTGSATGFTLNVIVRSAALNGTPGAVIDTTVSYTVGANLNGWINLPLRNGQANLPAGKIFVGVLEGNQPIPVSMFDNIFTLNSNWVNSPGLTTGWQTLESFQFVQTYGARINVGPPCPNLNPNTTVSQPSCNQPLGNILTNVSGGNGPYTYAWSNGATTSGLNNVPAGTYIVTITQTSTGCSVLDTVVLNPVNIPTINFLLPTNALCFGQNGQITANISGGTLPYTYLWSNGSSNDTLFGPAGAYSLGITDAAGCQASSQLASIGGPQSAISIASNSTNPSCGQTNGSITLAVTGGTPPYNITWSNGGTGLSLVNLAAGSFTASISDANGCLATSTIALVNPNSPTAASQAIAAPSCNGGNNGSISLNVSGGQAPYTYAWSNGSTTAILTAASGTYNVTVTDQAGCSTVLSGLVIPVQPPIQSAMATTNVDCNGNPGTATITATGGAGSFSFLWSNGTTTASISNLQPGQYTVVVTDQNGCSLIDTATILQSTPMSIDQVNATPALCAGQNGSVSLVISGGQAPYSYAWSNGSTNAILNAPAGTGYSVVVTDVAGCTVQAGNISITAPAPIAATFSVQDANCGASDGSISVNAIGGTGSLTYLWTTNGTFGATNSNLSAGFYEVTITDQNGCSVVDTGIVGNIGAPSGTATVTNANCSGDNGSITPTISGGQSPYSYAWSNGSSVAVLSAPAGSYTLVVTDASGCILNLGPYSITEPAPLSISVSTTDASGPNMPDGSATASVSGGTSPYTYSWSGGSNSNLLPGNYSVVVTDANGCKDSTAFTIGSTMFIQPETAGFSLYPNPASTQVQLDLSSLKGSCVVRLLDSRGRALTQLKAEGGQGLSLDVLGYAAGVYVIEIHNGENNYRQRLILRP